MSSSGLRGSSGPDLQQQKEELEKEIRRLHAALKAETAERDLLEDTTRSQEKKIRNLEKRLEETKEDLAREQRERDEADKVASAAERDKRHVELALTSLKSSSAIAAQEVEKLKEERLRMRQRMERTVQESEKETEAVRQQLRAERKAAKDAQLALQEERDDFTRQLNRGTAAMKRDNARLAARVEELERQLKGANVKLTVQGVQPSDAQKSLESALKEKLELENELAKTRAECSQRKEALDEAIAGLAKATEAKQKLEAEAKTIREKADESKEAITRLEEAKKKLEADLKDAVAARDDSVRVNTEVQKLRLKLEESERDRKAFSDTIGQLEENLADAKEAIERADEAKAAQEETAKELRAQAIEFREAAATAQGQLEAARAEAAAAKAQAADARKQSADTLAQLAASPKQQAREWPAKEAEELRRDLAEASEKLAGIEKECKVLKEQLPVITHERDSISSQLVLAKQERDSIAGQLHRTKIECEAHLAECEALKAKAAKHEAKAAELGTALEGMTAERDKAARETAKISALLESVRAEAATAGEKLAAAGSQQQELDATVASLKQQLREEQAAARHATAALSEQQGSRADAEEEVKRLKRKVEESDAELKSLREANRRISESQSLRTSAEKADILKLEDSVRRLEREKTALKSESERMLEEKTEKLSLDLAKLRKELLSAQDEAQDAEDKLHAFQLELKKAQARAAEAEAEVPALQQVILRLKDELKKVEDDTTAAEEETKLASKKARGLEEKCKLLEEDKAELEARLAEERKKTGRSSADIESMAAASQKQLKDATDRNAVSLKEVEELKKQLMAQTAEFDEERQALKRQAEYAKEKREQDVRELKKQLASASAPVPVPASTPAARQDPALTAEVAQLKEQNAALGGQIRDLQLRLADAEAAASAGPAPADEGSAAGEDDKGAKLGSGVRRAAPAGRRAPTLPGAAKRAGKDVTGAVALLPTGVASEFAAKKAGMGAPKASEEKKKVLKLIQLKGRRNVKSWVVEPASSSLNSGDVFILDVGDKIFQWNGSKCNRLERSKAVDLVAKLNRTRGGRAKVVVIDEGDTEPEEAFQFWKELGPKTAVKKPEEGGDDAAIEAQMEASSKLFRVTEAGEMEPIEGTKLMYGMLDAAECFVLDAGGEIYVFFGKNTAPSARNVAFARATNLLETEKDKRPPWCEVVRCAQGGGESVLFCEKFADWPNTDATLGPQKFASNVAASKKQERIDVQQLALAEPPERAPDVDDAAGKVEIWRVVESEKEPVDPANYGQFWSAHSYIVLYTYNMGGSVGDQSYVIYFWLGTDSTKNDMGTAAALALNMSKKYRGATQTRVVQQAEPQHFCKIFKGRVVTHAGAEGKKPAGSRMFHIRGTGPENTTAVQVSLEARHLNTRDVFVLVTAGSAFIWKGAASSDFAQQTAAALCNVIDPAAGAAAAVQVAEGKEPDAFWKLVGGKGEYGSADMLRPGWNARAFVFTTKTGTVTAEPLWRFSQADLHADAMLLLDSWSSVLLWTGPKTKEKDKKVAMETAIDYAKLVEQKDPSRGTVQVLQASEGTEPVAFTAHFHGWRQTGAGAAVAAAAMAAGAPSPIPAPRSAASVADALGEFSKKFSYEQLSKKRDTLPPTVDKSRLEMYLTDEEFQKVFGMTRAAYLALPAWQQTPKKKDAGLF